MQRIKRTVALAVLAMAATAQAGPIDFKHIPAESKWMVHVDVDALQDSKLWPLIRERVLGNPRVQDGIDQLQAATGLQVPQDFHDITVFGKASGEEAGVVMVHANADRNRIITALQQATGFASVPHGNQEIMSWDDKGKTLYGAFFGENVAIIGRSNDNVAAALDVLDGKAESIKADSPMAGGPVKSLAYVAARDLVELRKPGEAKSPIVSQVECLWLALGEDDHSPVLQAAALGKTPKAAEQIRSVVEGIRSMVNLAATAENPDPRAKLASEALAPLTTTLHGNTVNLRLPVELDLLAKLWDAAQQHRAAVTGPAR